MATHTPVKQINQIKRNDLKFVKQIGEGGFSSVYQMTWIHPSLGPIEIAAKKLIKRDVKELDIMSGLDHPNIVKLIGVVDELMDFMLILELCNRGSLRSYLQGLNGGRLSDQQFYDWAEQAARPLEYLKQKHLVHKDVKSPNYMVTTDNNLKLGDFGIAKFIDQTVGNATETASCRWMAPELFVKGILSPKYDIFAYAVVIWEMRTGKYPFEGLEPQVIAWRVCQKKERLPIPEDCPRPIKDLMKQCWKTDWKKRPSIEEIISVIKAAAKETRQKQITGPWKLERKFELQFVPGKRSRAYGIAVNPSNRDVAVAHWWSSQVYTNNGEYKHSMDTLQGLEPGMEGETSRPFQVTVNPQGTTYIITDSSNHVKCYDSQAHFTGQWVSSCPHASSGSPWLRGLAMDHEEHLLVGDCNSKHINRHRQDGSYLSSIKVGIEPTCIAVTSQGAIVVTEIFKPPQIVSSTGQVMCTLKHPVGESQWNPYGVYCHEDIILIANHTTRNILCYSESGKYLGDIPVSGFHSPKLPTGVAMTADGKKLLVCTLRSVHVYSL
ncbi:uncharacterized protein [Amphiura filiformis]|uniref:uncharacterized protein n=1 Tax=Amphiura filiformis TaxID=82378 RepID=UPI003B220E8A